MKYSFFLMFILLASCGDDNFNKVEVLKGFRILSVVMTNPATDSEVQEGTVVRLQLYVSDIEGAGRTQPIVGTATSCIDPGISLGAKVNCDHDPSAITGAFSLDTGSGDLPANLYTGLADDFVDVTVPVGIFTGRSARDQFNGVSYIVIFNFTVDGKEVSAFKRIVATNRSPKNDILEVTSNLPQTYEYITLDGNTETRTEELAVAWFVTQGEFDKPKSDVNESVKYLGSAPTVPSIVLTVVRDNRGGVEIVRRKL
jgi:hypothetical protein